MEKVEKRVREYVYSMAIIPKSRVSERDIAKRFNVKRNNAREILLAMEGEGILKRRPQVGYELVDYQESDKRTVMAIRYAVEREAARKATTHAMREDILRMTLILEEMEEILNDKKGDVNMFWDLDFEFHKALVNASYDNMLINIFSFIMKPLFAGFPVLGQLGPTHLAHKLILDALKKSDEEAMEREIGKHLSNFKTGE